MQRWNNIQQWSTRTCLLVVFLVALLARAVVCIGLYPAEGWASFDYGSELGQIAANLAEGRGFSSPYEPGDSPTAMFAPLVPALWALVFRLSGVFSSTALLILHCLHTLAGALACTVYAAICVRLWSFAGRRGMRTPLIVALCIAIWPETLVRLNGLWYFVWEDLGMALTFLMLLRWRVQPDWKHAICLGLAAGGAALVNPVVLLFSGVVLVFTLWERRLQFGPWLGSVVLAGVVLTVVLAPWTLRNLRVMGAWIPLRSNFGIELRQGNSPQGTILQTRDSLNPSVNEKELVRYQQLGETAYTRHAIHDATSYMLAHPVETVRRTLQRVYAFWCTDLLDQWQWEPRPPWWTSGWHTRVLKMARIGLALVPLLWIVWLGSHRWLTEVPEWRLLALALLVLPLSYYLTQGNPVYAHLVKPYVLLWGGLATGLGGIQQLVPAEEQ